MKRFYAALALILSTLGLAVALPSSATASDVVWAFTSPSPAAQAVAPPGAVWSDGLRAYVVTVTSPAAAPTYKVPVVEVLAAGPAAALTACPTGTPSQPNNGRFCAYTSTGFNGSVYMWNWQWKNRCVPVGWPYDNDVESFANGFPDQHAELNISANCPIVDRFQTIGPLGNDSNLSPYNNWLSSFLAY